MLITCAKHPCVGNGPSLENYLGIRQLHPGRFFGVLCVCGSDSMGTEKNAHEGNGKPKVHHPETRAAQGQRWKVGVKTQEHSMEFPPSGVPGWLGMDTGAETCLRLFPRGRSCSPCTERLGRHIAGSSVEFSRGIVYTWVSKEGHV